MPEVAEVRSEVRVRRVAARQHGLLTAAQLAASGWDKDAIAWRVKAGWLRRVHRGVYLVGPVEAEHARAMAAILAVPGSVLSHYPAAVLHGLRPPRGDQMHVTLPHGSHRRAGIIVHRAHLHPADVTRRHGIPVTSPTRTLLDLAATEPISEVDRALNEARARRLVSDPSLNGQFGRSPRHRGTTALKRAQHADAGFTRSKAEGRLKALVRRAGLPRPETNQRIEGHEVDAIWRERRLIVEFDGYATHATRRSFEEDRRRDQQLVAKGWRVVRITWRQLIDEPIAVVARLAAALAA